MLRFVAFAVLIAVAAAQLGLERSAGITRYLDQPNQGDGSYAYDYATSNGIQGKEQGVGGQQAQGSASWTDPSGIPVGFSWVADANGYRAAGSHIPTSPPIPEAILRSIEYIRTHPQSPNQIFADQRFAQQQPQQAFF